MTVSPGATKAIAAATVHSGWAWSPDALSEHATVVFRLSTYSVVVSAWAATRAVAASAAPATIPTKLLAYMASLPRRRECGGVIIDAPDGCGTPPSDRSGSSIRRSDELSTGARVV